MITHIVVHLAMHKVIHIIIKMVIHIIINIENAYITHLYMIQYVTHDDITSHHDLLYVIICQT